MTTTPSTRGVRNNNPGNIDYNPLMPGTYVENLPWLKCAQKYDRPHTVHYMDPHTGKPRGTGLSLGFDQYELMAEFMRACEGKLMVSINDHPDIGQVFEGLRMEAMDIRYSAANPR